MVLLHSEQLPMEWEAPDFMLPNTEGESVSPKDFVNKDALLIVFTCNHCPYAQASWPIIIDLYQEYKKNIAVIAINPNDEELYPEDSFEKMKIYKKKLDIPFPYLRDKHQNVTKLYNAVCTPDPYLFKNTDNTWRLFYHGRVNDNWQQPEAVEEESLRDALDALLHNQPPPQPQHPSMGCSIKWSTENH